VIRSLTSVKNSAIATSLSFRPLPLDHRAANGGTLDDVSPTDVRFPAVSVGLPAVGPHAAPSAVERIAVAADRLGYRSVSLAERLLLPAGPEWTNEYGLPDWPAFDALETLAWVAAKTQHVRLRTDVIVPLFQQPVVLARRLATLDHLSGARLEAGVALGWLPEEFAATGVPVSGRAAMFEECIAVLRACWAPDPVAFDGHHYHVPPSKIGPKPTQGAIPLAIGAVSRPGVERAARLGDGYTIGFRNWDDTRRQLAWYFDAGGTGPVIARGGPMLVDAEHETPPPTWSETHIVENLAIAADEGITEFIWDLNVVGYEPARQIDLLEALAEELDLPGTTVVPV
jgi:probable F420-dependent oxidoreductase